MQRREEAQPPQSGAEGPGGEEQPQPAYGEADMQQEGGEAPGDRRDAELVIDVLRSRFKTLKRAVAAAAGQDMAADELDTAMLDALDPNKGHAPTELATVPSHHEHHFYNVVVVFDIVQIF